jgi:enoyl-CoA hydratase
VTVLVETREVDGVRGRPVTVVTMERPERRNALDHGALAGLTDAVEDAASSDVRALVLTGAGGAFCSGADLNVVEDSSFAATLQTLLDGLRNLPCPTIAAVDGPALGAGSQLAVACDLRVATEASSFGVPAGKLGLIVNHWTVQRIATLLGPSAARAVLLGGEVVSGTDAHRIGFVNRLGTLDDAIAWAEAIAVLAPLTLAGHKLMLNRLEPPLPHDPEVDAAFERAWESADFVEGVNAFHERRRPRFRGF